MAELESRSTLTSCRCVLMPQNGVYVSLPLTMQHLTLNEWAGFLSEATRAGRSVETRF